jgi:hypothetical protein
MDSINRMMDPKEKGTGHELTGRCFLGVAVGFGVSIRPSTRWQF